MRKRVWLIFEYLSLILVDLFSIGRHTAKSKVVLHLKDTRITPYYAYLIIVLTYSGYKIQVFHEPLFLANFSLQYRKLLSRHQVKICYFFPVLNSRKSYLYIYDRFVQPIRLDSWGGVLKIDLAVFGPKPPAYILPYQMSPGQYYAYSMKALEELRASDRGLSIFFSGNQDPEMYDHHVLPKVFSKLTRVQAIKVLVSNLKEDELRVVEAEKSSEIRFQGLTIYKWKWNPVSSSTLNARIKDHLWLKKLAASQFFLCLSGIRMPICFNIIEAMAVGTIPILEYAEFFNPPLEHMKNAIVFEGEEDLIKKCRLALSMSHEEIAAISKNVIKYYDSYLCPEAAAEEINRAVQSNQSVGFFAEQASLDDSKIRVLS